jgi:hypothetical protein
VVNDKPTPNIMKASIKVNNMSRNEYEENSIVKQLSNGKQK